MELPAPISEHPYQNIMKSLSEESVKQSETLMCDAAKRIIDIVGSEEPEKE